MTNIKNTILIVDDVNDNIELLSNIITEMQQHIELFVARNGSQALKKALDKLPDLILLDISMPEMNGYEVCKELKNNPETQNIPIMFITARNQVEDIVHGFEVGAIDYITKPYNPNELISRVSTQLELVQKRRELEQMNQTLEQKVIERTIQLKEANEDLSKANKKLSRLEKAKNDFLILVNHELRTPLNGIIGFLQLIDDKNIGQDTKEFLGIIKQSADRLVELSELALLITSLRADSYKQKKQSIYVKQIFDALNENFGKKINEKNITIKSSVSPQGLMISIDRNLIYNCTKIILDNALEYSPEGETVTLTAYQHEKSVVISISDNGKGFSDEALNQLFEVFTTINIKHHTKGFGLGLATAKLIMDALSGKINIKNREEGGATVELIIKI